MADIKFPKKQEQRLIPKYLLEYATKLNEAHPDPEADWGGGGGSYTAGDGINITDDVISIDDTVVALKTDIPDVSDFVTTTELSTTLDDYELKADAFSGSYNDLTDKPSIPSDIVVIELSDSVESGTLTASEYTQLSTYPNKTIIKRGNYYYKVNLETDSYFSLECYNGNYNTINCYEITVQKSNYAWAYSTSLANYTIVDENLIPKQNNYYSLGSSSYKYENLYLAGNLTDGTNSVAIANIAKTNDLATVAISGDYDDLLNKPTIPSDTTIITLSSSSGYLTAEQIALIQVNPEKVILKDNNDYIYYYDEILTTYRYRTLLKNTDGSSVYFSCSINTSSGYYNINNYYVLNIDNINKIITAEDNLRTNPLKYKTYHTDTYNLEFPDTQNYTANKTIATTDDIPDISNYIQKSSTAGLVKNDGTIDTNTYALASNIPTVNNSLITIKQGGTTKGTFTLNQSSAATIELDAGGSSSTKYVHYLTLFNTTDVTTATARASAMIINSSNTAISLSALGTYLYNNNFRSTSNVLEASGSSYSNATNRPIIGIINKTSGGTPLMITPRAANTYDETAIAKVNDVRVAI